jgi:hypothetical protein
LRDEGVPADLAVVAHTNFPHPTPSAVPVARLGYDVAKLVMTCMERIDQQRRGEKPPALTLVPALWEGEVGAAKPPVVRGQKSVGRTGQGRPVSRRE